ncbi:MAG: hypothetical protein J7K21_02390 [Desulfurococcales archaeon]|nr:hypothetical protein [Desulfurococcales archaeon]
MIGNREFKVSKTHSGRPVLRKLTARLDSRDYRLDMNGKVLRIAVLDSGWVELKLLWYSCLDRYFNGSWKLREMHVSYRDNEIRSASHLRKK